AIELRQAEDVGFELTRFEEALATSSVDVEHARQRMRELVPEVGGALYEALRMIMEDQSFSTRVRDEISSGLAAESALKIVVNEYVERFERVDDGYLRERVVDVRDAGQRVLRHLLGVDGAVHEVHDDAVLVANELTLSDLAMVDHSRLRGIVTAAGGATSHAA